MTIVELEDGTTYYIDTYSEDIAYDVVQYKLRNRHDFRKIKNVTVHSDLQINESSNKYNSSNPYDRVPLKCAYGWSYKWSDTKCTEFR